MMKITITGSLGNISGLLSRKLANAGHVVTVISSDPAKSGAIRSLNAIPAIGSIADETFLQKAFSGADAVYLMIPPDFTSADLRSYMAAAGERYARVARRCGVKYILNLSSIGAHLADGPGPAGVNNRIEELYNGLTAANVLHLRPGMFYNNFYGAIQQIKLSHSIGNNFPATAPIVFSHPRDIADAAFEALNTLSFSGKKILYVAGDEKTGEEVAETLASAIGMDDLKWIFFSDEELMAGLRQSGMSEQMAKVYIVEMGEGIREGRLFDDYRKNRAHCVGTISLRQFAQEFAEAYRNVAQLKI